MTTTTTRTTTTTTTEPTTSSTTTTTTIPPTTTSTSTTSTEETTTPTTTTTTTTEPSSPTCSSLAATFGLTNGAWECNGNEQDDTCRWICDYGIPTGARAKCLSEKNHGDWKEPSAKNKAKADCSLCEEVSADITPENGTWECRNSGVKRICQLNCPDRRRPVFAECIVSRNQGFEINSQLSLEDNTCEAVIGPCDVSLVEENAPDNFKWNGLDYSTIFEFSTTHSNPKIALWGRRKCFSGEGFHHNTQILCKITQNGAKWVYKGNANKKCRND